MIATLPAGGFTPANHPLRNVKPDDWMLRNLRSTMDALRPLYASIDLSPPNKEQSNEPASRS